jgi:hypothetical protein
LMLSILTCFLWVGLVFVGFGDDVIYLNKIPFGAKAAKGPTGIWPRG